MLAAGSSFSNSSIPISYNITYSSAISSAKYSGLGIVGFTAQMTNDFSVNASVDGFTLNYIYITANVMDSTIVNYFAVHYIAVGGNAYFLEVQKACIPNYIKVFYHPCYEREMEPEHKPEPVLPSTTMPP